MDELIKIILLIFVYATMIGVGLIADVAAIKKTLKNWQLILSILIANLILIPLVGYLIVNVISPAFITEDIGIAIMLIMLFTGAPIGMKFVDNIDGDKNLAVVSLTVVSLALIIFVPFTIKFFMGPDVSVSVLSLVKTLIIMILIPFSVGMTIAKVKQETSGLLKIMTKISSITLPIVILGYTIINFHAIITTDIILFLMFIVLSVVMYYIGYLTVIGSKNEKATLALLFLPKNLGIVLVLATTQFAAYDTMPTIMVFGIVSLVVGVILSRRIKLET